MIRRIAAVLLLSVIFAGTSQAFTISISGTLDLLTGTAGAPAGFPGAGTYAYDATIVSVVPPNPFIGNPAIISTASLIIDPLGTPFPIAFTSGTLLLSGVTPTDTAVIDLVGPMGTSVSFSFTNTSDPISLDQPNDTNVPPVINGGAGTITGTLFSSGTPAIIGGISSVDSAVAVGPEPSSFALLAVLSIGGAGIYRIRRKRAAAAA